MKEEAGVVNGGIGEQLGATFDSETSVARLSPGLEPEIIEGYWLRFGESFYDIRVTRRGRTVRIQLKWRRGNPLWFEIAPMFASPPEQVLVDGAPVPSRSLPIKLLATTDHELEFV